MTKQNEMMTNQNDIAIELERSLQGTHQYRRMSSGRGITASETHRDLIVDATATAAGDAVSTLTPRGLLYPELSYDVVGALIEVHRWLGPGQLESIYQRAVEKELALRGIPFEAQVPVPARYKGDDMGELVVDVIVDRAIVLELKAVTCVLPVHRAQLMSYLRATGCRLGLLVNFHVPVMVQGVKRIAL
jgi:GxxExxY protein